MSKPQAQAATDDQNAPKTRADDADIPAGDSPPQPRWPLVFGVSAWVLWLGFLVVMMVVRIRTTAV